jgi:hypothetical protein
MDTKKGPPIDQTPGLAGGPGPTPPGVEDGTPTPTAAQPETVPRTARAQQEAGEIAEREAGTRDADVRGARRDADRRRAPKGDPEEPDPS